MTKEALQPNWSRIVCAREGKRRSGNFFREPNLRKTVPQSDVPGEQNSPMRTFPELPPPTGEEFTADDARGVIYFDRRRCSSRTAIVASEAWRELMLRSDAPRRPKNARQDIESCPNLISRYWAIALALRLELSEKYILRAPEGVNALVLNS